MSKMSAFPDDIAFKIPYFHYRIPDPNSSGWVPIMKGMERPKARKSKSASKKVLKKKRSVGTGLVARRGLTWTLPMRKR